MTKKKNPMKYPATNEEIDILNYQNLNLNVFNHLVNKFGPWLYRHKADLLQSGMIGLLKAKEKYIAGRGSFLGLAYLRIMSQQQLEIAKYAKFEMNTTPLENMKNSVEHENSDKLSWEDSFGGVILDYEAIFKMIMDDDDKRLLVGLVDQYPYWKLRAILKETKEEHEERVEHLRVELVDIVEVLHINESISLN